MRLIFFFTFLCFPLLMYPAEIYGRVTDENNEPLPFAGIYIKGTSQGCATNIDGEYTFRTPPGTYTLIFQFLGYQQKEISITLGEEKKEIDVQLKPDNKMLESVTINADDEDPAYAIIREAIKSREIHGRENDHYSCDVYIKGLQRLKDAPDQILGVKVGDILDIDSTHSGVFYLSESASKFYFQYPDKVKEIMYASKTSGNNNQFSYNDAGSMQIDFYKNNIEFLGLSQRGIVSPIADNALFFYDYALQGSFIENDITIYKISVLPKRKTDPVLTGNIYITGNSYHIYSADLYLTKNNGVDFIDTFQVKQSFIPLPENRWVLLSNQFSFSYNIFGFNGEGYTNAFYKNYVFDSLLAKHFFNGEISRIEDDANKKDTSFWENERPVKLTDEETLDYHRKDSVFAIKNTDTYKDSMDHVANRLRALDFITGYAYRNTSKKIYISFSPFADFIQFNTIDGYVTEPSAELRKVYSNERVLAFSASFRYGFESHAATSQGSVKYEYDNKQFAFVQLSGGADIRQINPQGISKGLNSLYTLFLEENYLKLYRADYIALQHSTEIWNGFYLSSGLSFAKRTQLFNDPELKPYINNEEKKFTSNTLSYDFTGFEEIHGNKFLISLGLRYVIGQKYISVPGKKYIAETKYPSLNLNLQKAVAITEKYVSYDYIELKAEDDISLKLAGNFHYAVTAGKFFNTANMSAPDLKHFSGNETLFSKLGDNKFLALPYYTYSTVKPFLETHAAYHTEGFLFNKLPLFKQLKLQPVFSANALFTQEAAGNYLEIAAGVEHLFKFLRIDLVAAKQDDVENIEYSVKLGFGF